jgi:hypothetical protein
MATIRKREWMTKRGQTKVAWQVNYVDQQGTRRRQMFALKKAADAFVVRAQIEVREGTHVADAASLTVAQAGEQWLATARAVDDPPLERTTIEQYVQHLRLHIVPFSRPDQTLQAERSRHSRLRRSAPRRRTFHDDDPLRSPFARILVSRRPGARRHHSQSRARNAQAAAPAQTGT